MKKLLTPSFFPKLITLLLIFAELLGLTFGVLALLSWSTDPSRGASFLLFFILIVLLANSIANVYILNSDSPLAYKMSWMFWVNVLPVGGIILYLLFANKTTTKVSRRKLRKWAYPLINNPTPEVVKQEMEKSAPNQAILSDYLSLKAGQGAHDHTYAHYYALVEDAWQPILESLKSAKHYIYIEFFIVAPGKFFDSMLEILEQKAKEGVDVRLIYDDVGSLGTAPSFWPAKLRSHGLKVAVYNPMRPFLDVRQTNRDHRKILVVDGHTGWTGGFNLADEYVNQKMRFGHWKDNAIELRGEAVYTLTLLFLSTWVVCGHRDEVIDKDYYRPETYISEIGGFPESEGFVQPYGDWPYDRERVGESVYLSILGRAEKYVYITTPYLILDEETENALCRTAKSGVDVRIVTPHIPDKKAVFQVTRSYYGKLLKAGVKIYEYTPGFVHEKTFLSDDVVATCGTINLDYRSLFLHMENGTLLMNAPAIEDIKKDFAETFAKCHEVSYQEWKGWRDRNIGYWTLLKAITPML